MKTWKNDVNVLLIFFVRDEVFSKTFEAVREARPRRLLLYQDGPRVGVPEDIIGIRKCREIAEKIDWECEVYRNYQEKNWGCDPATFFSHKWAFSIVDKCIVLEDDCVPSQSFFPFCCELLEKYENDQRIGKICGMNNLGVFETPYDYFFARTGSCGWATWKRVADLWDENYSFLKNDYYMDLLAKNPADKKFTTYLTSCRLHAQEGKPHWETIQSLCMLLNNQINIFPTRNLVQNVGLTENSAHSMNDIKLVPRRLAKFYKLPKYELEFPLKHPPYIVESYDFKQLFNKLMSPTFLSKLEGICRKIIYGRSDLLLKALRRRLK